MRFAGLGTNDFFLASGSSPQPPDLLLQIVPALALGERLCGVSVSSGAINW
jgi:hypothetical protein